MYYKRLDPDGNEEIAAVAAATFLKKSGLSDEKLGKVKYFDLPLLSVKPQNVAVTLGDFHIEALVSNIILLFRYGNCLILMAKDFLTEKEYS